MSDFLSGRATLNDAMLYRLLIYTKSHHWEYEQEWRIDAEDRRRKFDPFEDVRFDPADLKAVIFGSRMTQGHRSEMTDIVRQNTPTPSSTKPSCSPTISSSLLSPLDFFPRRPPPAILAAPTTATAHESRP